MGIRRSLGAVSAVVIAGATLFAVAGPAHAGCGAEAGRGDARIRAGNAPFEGIDVFNCDGTGQTVFKVTPAGKVRTFDVKILNDSGSTADIRVFADTFDDVNQFRVRLFVKGKNVTEKVLSTGKLFKDVADGKSTKILKIEVKGKGTVGEGDAVGIDASGLLDDNPPDTADTVIAGAGMLS